MRTATAHLHITEHLLDARKAYEDTIQWALDSGFTETDIQRILTRPAAERLAEESTHVVLEGPVVSQQEGPQPAKPKPKPVRRARRPKELPAVETDDTVQVEPVQS
jgi:hypothetical protein